MLLRYLSIDVQIPLLQHSSSGKSTLDAFIEEDICYGVYTRLSNAGFTRSDFEAIKTEDRRISLFNHRLALFLISDIIRTLPAILENSLVDKAAISSIASKLKRTLRDDELAGVDDLAELTELTTDICNEKLEELDEHVASVLPGGQDTLFNPWLSLSSSVKGLLEKIKSKLKLRAPFFLLLDDFDSLSMEQQSCILNVARERNHDLVCYKLGLMTLGLKTSLAGNGIIYREGDDYDRIHLQWHDKGLSSNSGMSGNYKKTVEEIAQRRIEASNWPNDRKYKTIFNTWKHGNSIRNDLKKETEREYLSIPEEERSPKTLDSLWSKQGDSLYFRKLRQNKVEHRYAGSDNLVDISSGIFRQFLEINSRIVSAALDNGWDPSKAKKIGPDLQNNQIRLYSEDMLRNLGQTAGDTSSLSQCEHDITSAHLVNLTDSLIGLFADRLYNGGKDGEVISISVKGDMIKQSFGKALLDVAVRESILQRREIDYSSKTHGGGKLPTYSLNRRLAPKGQLGLKMQGRYEIDINQIEVAAKNSKKFIAENKLKVSENKESEQPVQVDLYER